MCLAALTSLSLHCIRADIIIGLDPEAICHFPEFSFESTKPGCLTYPACRAASGLFQGPVTRPRSLLSKPTQGRELCRCGSPLLRTTTPSRPCRKSGWAHTAWHALSRSPEPLPKSYSLLPPRDSPSPIKRCLLSVPI